MSRSQSSSTKPPVDGLPFSIRGWLIGWLQGWSDAWNRFWFSRRHPSTLSVIRILTGSIAFYCLLVWTKGLAGFLSPSGMLPSAYRDFAFGNSLAWSHLDWFASPSALMIVHLIGMAIVLAFTLGFWTRVTSILTAMLVISYANRATGALFGLDQILGFLCLYLAIGNSGACFSIEHLLRRKRLETNGLPKSNGLQTEQGRGVVASGVVTSDAWTNIAIRLIQIHMCIVYLFAGLGKLSGETWWNGEAIWYSLASYEYQTLDMTWMASHMWLVSLITLITVAWEVTYVALIWPRLTRPIMLLIAIPIHLGIGMCMGMMTFGLVMLVGNLAFVQWPYSKNENQR